MTRYVEQFNECTDPVTGDFLWIVDASAGATDKDRKVNISRFAILANAQTFTTTQTIAPTATGVAALNVTSPSGSSVPILNINYAASRRISVVETATSSSVQLDSADLGNGAVGPYIRILGNTNATQSSSGSLILDDRAGSPRSLWIDAANNLRTHSTSPTNFATDTSGTVVGTQTSSLDSKNVLGEFTDYDAALQSIVNAPLYDFTYKSGAFNGERFTGVITDYAPLFGMDRDEAHPAGKSLNEVTAHGYTMAAIKALAKRIEQLEAR